ncbi:MAG: hypothetical protein NVS9B9_02070 [Ktedonobacteraceae bacterium]
MLNTSSNANARPLYKPFTDRFLTRWVTGSGADGGAGWNGGASCAFSVCADAFLVALLFSAFASVFIGGGVSGNAITGDCDG